MNAIVRGKVFKSGNSVAVRLPKSFGLQPGMALDIEQADGEIRLKPAFDLAEHQRHVRAMVDGIAAVWEKAGGPPRMLMPRDPDIFPDRPGLY